MREILNNIKYQYKGCFEGNFLLKIFALGMLFFSLELKAVIEDYLIIKFKDEPTEERLSQFQHTYMLDGLKNIEFMGVDRFYSASVAHKLDVDINALLRKILNNEQDIILAYIDEEVEIETC